MTDHALNLKMSTVNLAEVLILIRSRLPDHYNFFHGEIYSSSIQFLAPTEVHAEWVASTRLKYPINLGDCFAYALAKEENEPLLTLDEKFKKTDVELLSPPF